MSVRLWSLKTTTEGESRSCFREFSSKNLNWLINILFTASEQLLFLYNNTGSWYSLNKLQNEVRDELGRSDDERSGLVERLGVVFDVTNLPHQRGQTSEKENTDVINVCLILSHTNTVVSFCHLFLLKRSLMSGTCRSGSPAFGVWCWGRWRRPLPCSTWGKLAGPPERKMAPRHLRAGRNDKHTGGKDHYKKQIHCDRKKRWISFLFDMCLLQNKISCICWIIPFPLS